MHKVVPVAIAATLLLAACTPAAESSKNLVLVTHDSFALSEGTLAEFTTQTGIAVDVQSVGDAGELVNKLVLTKDSPLGDVVYGIDNTFASRAVSNGVLESYISPDVTAAEAQFVLPADQGGNELTPIDSGDVCVNVDHAWFTDKGIAEPTTLSDLADPKYKNLLVVEAANSSSPGLAFVLATIAAFGEGDDNGWKQYWQALVDNGVKIDASWTDAYYSDFSGPSSEGNRPLVVSYASSPPFEPAGATGALLDTCFQQTEYAGIIAGSSNVDGAKKLVDFLHSVTVQNDIPENMYVFPVNPAATLPDGWDVSAPRATNPWEVDPADIDTNRERWITEWAAVATP